MNLRAGMTLESMAALIIHQINPSGSHVTYDQMRHLISQDYDRNSKYWYNFHKKKNTQFLLFKVVWDASIS